VTGLLWGLDWLAPRQQSQQAQEAWLEFLAFAAAIATAGGATLGFASAGFAFVGDVDAILGCLLSFCSC